MIGEGLKRRKDGWLVWSGGRHYREPEDGEAILTWWGGELRPGCNACVQGDWTSGPCGKKPKHDPDAKGRPTRCGMHSAEAIARRKAKSEARYQAQRAKWDRAREQDRLRREALQIVRRIAEGHNDPRGIASEWFERARAAGIAILLEDKE